MRTPILIQSGSLLVQTEKTFDERFDSESDRWVYHLPFGFVNRATIDAVTLDGGRFEVRGDPHHRKPADREVRIFLTPQPGDTPALILTVARGEGLTVSAAGRLARRAGTGRAHAYVYTPEEPATAYAYEIVSGGSSTGPVRGLDQLALIVNARWELDVGSPGFWACLALGAGVAVAGGLLLGRSRTGELPSAEEPSTRAERTSV